jgi:tetratricopeptide (TPR) repeat protein
LLLKGNLYCELGRYEDAIENFKQCLRLQQEHKGNEHESTAQILISLGATHALHKEYDRSKNAYKKAIHVLKKSYGNYKDVGICWLKVGDVHMKENCLEEAIPCYEEGLSIIKAIDETDGSLWDAYYGLGLCYLRQNRYKEALSALSNALILPTTSHNVQKRSDTLIPLGIAQFNIGDLDDSLENLNEAINASISRLNGVVEAENVHKGIDIALEICKCSISFTFNRRCLYFSNSL